MVKNEFEIGRQDAVDLLVDLGIEGAATLGEKDLLGVLLALPERFGDAHDAGPRQGLYEGLCDAVGCGDEVVLAGFGDAGKSGAKVKPGAKVKKKMPVDRFGTRVGTKCAEINKLLTKRPQSERRLVEKIDESRSYVFHLDKLVRLGYAAYDEARRGYYLTGKTAEDGGAG